MPKFAYIGGQKPTRVKVYRIRELQRLVRRGKLQEKVVQSILDEFRKGEPSYDWWEYMLGDDFWKAALDAVGFEDADIAFSGFSRQGDGASFTASPDVPKLIHFLSTDIKPKECIDCDEKGKELWLPWVVHKLDYATSLENPKFTRLNWVYQSGLIEDVECRRLSHQYCHENTCDFSACLRDHGEGTGIPGRDWQWHSDTPRVASLFEDFVETCESLRYDLCRAIYKSLEEEYEYLTSDENIAEMLDDNDYLFTLEGQHIS